MSNISKLYYVGSYAPYNDDRYRGVAMSSISKMDYVSKAIKEAGIPISIFSITFSRNPKLSFYGKRKWKNKNGIEVIDAPMVSANNPLMKALSWLLIQWNLFWLLVSLGKEDKVLIYHRMVYRPAVKIWRLFSKRELIFEVEELYSAAWEKDNYEDEIDYLRLANKYIYVNDIMPQKFPFGKPYVVCYGNYEPIMGGEQIKKNDIVNLIYAGVIGGKDSDVYVSIETIKHLPDNYRLEIAGYGTAKDIKELQLAIEGNPRISYHGCLYGKGYDEFLNSGHFGMCTRVLDDDCSDYTFPSKIMVYLNHGLKVVCPQLRCLTVSQVSKHLLFVDSLKPEVIADAIKNCEMTESDPKKYISKIHEKFVLDIKNLFLNK